MIHWYPLIALLVIGVLFFALYIFLRPSEVRQAVTSRGARYGSNAVVISIAFIGIVALMMMCGGDGVADVDALVKDGSAIDEHARHNTTSVYTAAQIFHPLFWVDEAGGTILEHLSRPFDLGVQLSYQGLLGRFGYHILQQGTFWRRDVHEKIGYLDESLHYAMDAEFFIRAGSAGMKLRHIPEMLAAFRALRSFVAERRPPRPTR